MDSETLTAFSNELQKIATAKEAGFGDTLNGIAQGAKGMMGNLNYHVGSAMMNHVPSPAEATQFGGASLAPFLRGGASMVGQAVAKKVPSQAVGNAISKVSPHLGTLANIGVGALKAASVSDEVRQNLMDKVKKKMASGSGPVA